MKKLKLFFLILPVFIFVFLFAISATAYAADCGTPPAPYPQCGAAAGACVGAPIPTNRTVIVTTTFDNDCNKVYGCEDKGVLPGQCGNPAPSSSPSSNVCQPPAAKTVTTCLGPKTMSDVCTGVQQAGYPGPYTPEQTVIDAFNRAACPTDNVCTNPTGSVTTCLGSRTLADVCTGLRQAGYPGPWSPQQTVIDAFNRAACPSGSPSPSGSPGTCAPDGNLTISPSSPKVGDTMIFQYRAGEDVYIGGDTWSGGVNPNPCTLDSNLANRRYTCSAQSAVTNATWKHYWNNGRNCGSATYTITGAAVFTTKFRIAENPTDLAAAEWQDYTAAGMNVPFEFTDKTPGVKTVFVQFKDSNGKTGGCGVDQNQSCQAQIKLLGSDPAMTGCSLSFEESSAVLNLTGQNFGSTKGTVKSGDTDLQIRSWKNDRIQAVLQNAPIGQVLPVTFTNTDGQTGTGQCSSISQLALGAKIFCRAPASHDTDNVDMALVDETGKKIRQTVRIDKNGIVQGLTQRLEDGRRYTLSLKAPKSLKRNVQFTAGNGTVNIPNFVLPVGDIFPADGGDGIINSLDKSELNREWNISGDATGRLGDFNRDSRVNSIDWACMRYDFGQQDDPEPRVPPPPPSPSPIGSPAPTCKPRPACLDAKPRACEIAEPLEGWCPTPSPSPSLSPSPKPSP